MARRRASRNPATRFRCSSRLSRCLPWSRWAITRSASTGAMATAAASTPTSTCGASAAAISAAPLGDKSGVQFERSHMDNNRNAPATRGDLQDLEARFDEKLEALEVRLDTRLSEFERRMEQLFSVMEARVVTTIYRLGDAAQQRLTAAEREAAAIIERLAGLEQRLLDLEKRLDVPPQPIQ